MKLKKSHTETVVLGVVFLPYVVFYTYLTTKREINFDTAVYLEFYQKIQNLSYHYANCMGFEPFFCYTSKLLSTSGLTPYTIQVFWSFLTIALIIYGILRFSNKRRVKLIWLVIPLTLNFYNPSEIFFLTRQFVAGAFLLNFFVSKERYGGFIWGTLAIFTHFFCLPLILLFILSKSNLIEIVRANYKKMLLVIIFIVMLFPEEINLIRAILEYKFYAYQGKNDGSVSALSEVKFLLYFATAYYLADQKVRIFLIYCFLFYCSTFLSPLAHLRYHKYFYFIFMYAFLFSTRLNLASFMSVVSVLGIFRFNSIVKWQTNGFGLDSAVKTLFREVLT